MKKFILLFVVLLLAFFYIEQIPSIQKHVIEPFTYGLARVSAGVAQVMDSDVYSSQDMLASRSSGFAVVIRPGCNGVEAMVILLAAILAFPATRRSKALGLAVGVVAIQLLNLVRIISLFYLGQWNTEIFEFSHVHLWPALIILDALLVFMIWIHRQPKPQPPAASNT